VFLIAVGLLMSDGVCFQGWNAACIEASMDGPWPLQEPAPVGDMSVNSHIVSGLLYRMGVRTICLSTPHLKSSKAASCRCAHSHSAFRPSFVSCAVLLEKWRMNYDMSFTIPLKG